MEEQYIDAFYKKAINGKKGNLFTRVDALEELLKNLQVRDTTQFITQIIQENKEIIIPSLVGGVTDPTDETFSGIVISPSGQLIDGVLYSFAIVVDGVVISGIGDDGDPVIVTDSNALLIDGSRTGATDQIQEFTSGIAIDSAEATSGPVYLVNVGNLKGFIVYKNVDGYYGISAGNGDTGNATYFNVNDEDGNITFHTAIGLIDFQALGVGETISFISDNIDLTGAVGVDGDIDLTAGHQYLIDGTPISAGGLTHPQTMARVSIGF